MLLEELFDIGEEIELRHAKMYAYFSLVHGEWDERIASFWEQMSTDEWQHYMMLNFCRSLCQTHGGLQKEIPNIDKSKLEESWKLLDEGISKVQNGKLSLQDTFELAIKLEKEEADTIFEELAQISCQIINNNYLNERIRKALKQSEHHMDRLLQAVKRFSGSPALVREAQQQLSK